MTKVAPPGESEYNTGTWHKFAYSLFIPLSYSAPPLPIFPVEFRGEVTRQETRVMGLLCGEGCVILTSTVFDCMIHPRDGQTARQTDRQTDGRWHIARYSIYAVAR